LNYNGSVLGFDQTIRVYIRPLEAGLPPFVHVLYMYIFIQVNEKFVELGGDI
jgi:hypothetical protein